MNKVRKMRSHKLFVIAAILFGGSLAAPAVYAEPIPIPAPTRTTTGTITGKVVDEKGEPLIGATVVVKGTNVAAVADLDGQFTLKAAPGATLGITYVGYNSVTVKASAQPMEIKMAPNSKDLGELVVVGYGVQKKETLTGAVSQVKGDEVLAGKATQNVAAALQGTIPGLTITRTSSRPGNEGTSISLRGGISVNSMDPMIVIDGVEAYQWELSQINPSDIESISVLKDGAAAIYGTKAGAGVILVTTKRGQVGKVKITYSGSVHANFVGRRFPVASGTEWANMLIDATTSDAYALLDDNGNPQYNWWMWPEQTWRDMAAGKVVEGVVGGAWRVLDPYVNQFDEVYGTTWGTDHNVQVSGGNDKVKAVTSFGYADDRSLVDVVYDGQKKYNFRSNIDYKLNDLIRLEVNMSYDQRTTKTPQQGIGHGIQDFYIFPLYNEYGQYYDTFGNNNLLAKLTEGGTRRNTEEFTRLGGRIYLDFGKWVKGLGINASANFRFRKHKDIQRQTTVTMYDWAGEKSTPDGLPDYSLGTGTINSQTGSNDLWVKNTLNDSRYQVYNAFITYNNTFKEEHTVGVMAGVTAERSDNQNFYQYRKGMSVDELDDINLGDATTSEATGGSDHVGMISYLARLNYDYKGTYLLEGIFRRDGSSRFSKKNRWSNFANISAGIRLSQYDFIQNLNVINNLKIRGSYGETGSQSGIGMYDYISGISTGTTIFGFDGTKVPTSWVNGMTSDQRTWERIATTNVGLDFGFFNNRLSGSFDWFLRQNKGMLISVSYPSSLGAGAPKTNSGNYQAKGWELVLNWNSNVGNVAYNVGFTLADARTKVTKYEGANEIKVGKNGAIEGKPTNSIYVYKTDGYLQNWDEVNAYYDQITQTAGGIHPTQGTTNQLTPGCVRRVDTNNDGRITTDDLVYYGDAAPHYTFGINLNANWKGIDFCMFFQGVGQQYVLREGQMMCPWFSGWTNQNKTFIGNTWTAENTDARYPIASRNGDRNNWNYKQYNDINVNNCWYVRCKNVQLGYTFPQNLTKRVFIENLRVYVSADNLFEFHNVKDGFDPESKSATGQGNIDVFARTLSFGLNVTF